MITMDDRELKDLEKDFRTFAIRALPFATRKTINDAAFVARHQSREAVDKELITRNAWTKNSIQVEQARGLRITDQEARMGSAASYFPNIEFGGVTTAPLATTSSSGESENAPERLRMPRKPNKMASINLRRGKRSVRGRKAQNAERVRSAGRGARGFVYLDLQRTKGIFKILGSKKRPKIKMMWVLDGKTRVVPKTPIIGPATEAVKLRIPGMYKEAMIQQARRHRLFGWK